MHSVLIVDDDAEFRLGLRIMLENKNHQIFEAGNGKEAQTLLEREHIDLVIMDLLMPEREGIESIQAIRLQHPDVKIIAISGGESVALRMAEKLGANASFPKAMGFAALAGMIEKVVSE